jgi:hypothetical protein
LDNDASTAGGENPFIATDGTKKIDYQKGLPGEATGIETIIYLR